MMRRGRSRTSTRSTMPANSCGKNLKGYSPATGATCCNRSPTTSRLVVEKNTIYTLALRVAKKYQIPTVSGRGFASIDAWHDIADRFEASGREQLILIILSDYDPEGQMIPHVGGRTLRDDFGIDELTIVQAGVTRDQIDEHNLPPQNFAKETSSNFDWFVAETGSKQVYELEALPPEALLADLDLVIRSVIDVDLYNREVQAEREESAFLSAARTKATEALKGIAD